MLQLVLLLLGSNIFAKTLSVVVGLAVGTAVGAALGAAVGAQVCPAALQGVQFCVCASRVSVAVLMLR